MPDDDQIGTQSGYRFHRLEVLNWGTFNRRVWPMESNGLNSLLIGENGSGKSTLVDAIITLLVPHHTISYNKAAGLMKRERTLSSYVRGEYKNQKDGFGITSKPVCLRENTDYTVLLGYFYNKDYGQKVTLVQVFWEQNEKIAKMFVLSTQDLNIKDHFTLSTDVKDMSALKKKIRAYPDTRLFDTFSEYSSNFRNIFGIKAETALALFNKTVYLKAVDNLTDFVRENMIEKPDVKTLIDDLKNNYENLRQAHEAVQKAKRQMELLEPLVKDSDEYEKIENEIKILRGCQDYLKIYFAGQKSALLQQEIERLSNDLKVIDNNIEEIKTDINKLKARESDINRALSVSKEGQRISEIKNEISRIEETKASKLSRYQRYSGILKGLDIPVAADKDTFYRLRTDALARIAVVQRDLDELRHKRDPLSIEHSKLNDRLFTQRRELESLKQRKTQIPENNLNIRGLMAQRLNIDETDLPFVGELLKVKDNEPQWEGAIERALHDIGLSILVSEKYYRQVSAYVDSERQRGKQKGERGDKIVYFKVYDNANNRVQNNVPRNSLPTKVEIKSDTPFGSWIEKALADWFDHVCCDSIEQFRREPKAITKNGQIKGGRSRHVKDDRWDINDRRRYILGWSNQEKIKAIEDDVSRIQSQMVNIEAEIRSNEAQQRRLGEIGVHLHDITVFEDYSEINWQKDVAEIERLKTEMVELEKSSDLMHSLESQLKNVMNNMNEKGELQENLLKKHGRISSYIEAYNDQLKTCIQILSEPQERDNEVFSVKIVEFLPKKEFNIKTIERDHVEARERIDKVIADKSKISIGLRESFISKMQQYKAENQVETMDILATAECIPDFRKFLSKVKEEDLPRHAARFRQALREGTINDIALFRSKLERFSKDIVEKIKRINESLVKIEYDRGTYIKLLAESNIDVDISEFTIMLRKCLEDTLGETDTYNEEKYKRVKQILDKFNSVNPVDINWTEKVTDVRNWYIFNASERWIADDTEKEFYSDSSGKSGGQKEKLAYTILASALAYQFGLDPDQSRSRSFRFVVIDEAFGRGSNENTRYGLKLFKQLNLQLLIVTPLLKLDVMEGYINTVHYVVNVNGDDSVIKNMTWQEYIEGRDEKEKQYFQTTAQQ